jgi:hypothetical protein
MCRRPIRQRARSCLPGRLSNLGPLMAPPPIFPKWVQCWKRTVRSTSRFVASLLILSSCFYRFKISDRTSPTPAETTAAWMGWRRIQASKLSRASSGDSRAKRFTESASPAISARSAVRFVSTSTAPVAVPSLLVVADIVRLRACLHIKRHAAPKVASPHRLFLRGQIA